LKQQHAGSRGRKARLHINVNNISFFLKNWIKNKKLKLSVEI
jgi:hypothetical protein